MDLHLLYLGWSDQIATTYISLESRSMAYKQIFYFSEKSKQRSSKVYVIWIIVYLFRNFVKHQQAGEML